MWLLPGVLVLCLCIGDIVCPPVNPQPEEQSSDPEVQDTGLEYDRYLQEVVNALEQDEEFKKKLEEANITEIKSGKIAMHLDRVAHNVREKLDEIKRREVARLRDLAKQRMKAMQGTDVLKYIAMYGGIQRIDENLLHHVDVSNPHTFEMKDLERLIKKATTDLDEIDKKRREEFKQYEMEKEHERKEHLKELPEEDRKKEEQKFEDMKKKHKDHPKIHHPGSKDQLEEVWEKQDHLEKESFNPKSFFRLHDLDGNKLLDEEEVEALFQKELDEVYDPNAPEDDMEERYEEMSRMREHVMKEIDKDGDKLISLKEFMEYTNSADFEKDEGWETLDNEEPYTPEELQEYEKMLMEEENRRRQQGTFDSHAQPGLVMQPHHDPNVQQMEMPHQGAPVHQQGQFGQPLHPEQVQAMQAQQAHEQMMAAQQAQMHAQQQGQMHPEQQAQMHAQQQAQMHAQQQGQMHPQQAQMHAQQQAQMHAQQQGQMHPQQAQMHAQQQAQMQAQQQGQMHPQQAQMHAQQQAQMHAQQQAQVHAQQQAQMHAQQKAQQQAAQQAQGQPPAAQPVQGEGQPPAPKQEQAQGQVPANAQGHAAEQGQDKPVEDNKPVV